jgi:hypothetical protein
MARRLAPTLADYMAIAISPALIMGLVGSLAFFLLDLTYHGENNDRLQWILSWFVMAIVLIARIAIVEGAERASMFGLALAGVMMLAVMRFAPSYLMLTPFLLALIWWCAHELTWNCTWIDDDEDPGGEGLLQAAGLDRPEESDSTSSQPRESVSALPQQSKRPWWRRLNSEKRRRARAPGVTIVWFSLAALPIFGLGQLAIPASDVGRRQHAFWLATIYVGCGLGLLLNTAFLGLRRYLRRRGLEMPASISGGWLTLGALMIGALLVAGALLPRPSAEYSLARAAVEASKNALGANRWAPVSGSAGEGEGASGGEGDQEPQQQGDAEGEGEPGGSQEGDAESGAGEKQGSKGQSGEKGGKSQSSSQGKNSSQGKSDGKQQSGSDKQLDGQKGQQSEGKGKGQDSGQQKSDQQGQDSSQQGNDNQGEQGSEDQADEPNNKDGDQGQGREDQSKGDAAKSKSGSERRSSGGSGSRSSKSDGKSAEPSSAAKPPSHPSTTQPLQDFAQQANNLLGSLSGVAKLLKWLLVTAAVCFFVWQFGPELRRMLEALLAWLRALFGGGEAEDGEEPDMPEEAVLRRLSFSQFSDPFLSGLSDRASPDQLVAYTFAALEAWGREAGLERTDDQTPLEFSEALAAKFPPLDPAAAQTAEFYTFLAYGRGRLTPQVRGPLEALWQSLRSEAMSQRAGGESRVMQI